MSECVVRMEMPSDCERCPMCGTESGGNGMYELWCMCGDIPANSQKRPEDCPIICQLPEGHGKLVDEKEVKDWVENWLCTNKYYHPYSSSRSIPVMDLYDVFQRMDASVPADTAERSET